YVVDVPSGDMRLLARPPEGIYAGGPLTWSADGSELFELVWACVQCDGGSPQLDVLDATTGQIIRSYPKASHLATTSAGEVIGSPDGMYVLADDGGLRELVPDEGDLDLGYRVAVSPERSRLAALVGDPNRAAAYRVQPDGSGQALVASFDRYAEVIGPSRGGWLLAASEDRWLVSRAEGANREILLPSPNRILPA